MIKMHKDLKIMDRKHNEKGFTMIEIVAAIVILGIVSIPLLNMFVISSQGQRVAYDEEKAYLLGQEMIEFFKLNSSSDQFKNYGFDEQHVVSQKPAITKWVNYYSHDWQRVNSFKAAYMIECELSNVSTSGDKEKKYVNRSPIKSNKITIKESYQDYYIVGDENQFIVPIASFKNGIHILYEVDDVSSVENHIKIIEIDNQVEDNHVVLYAIYKENINELILDMDNSQLGGGISIVDYSHVNPSVSEKDIHLLQVKVFQVKEDKNQMILVLDSIKFNDTD